MLNFRLPFWVFVGGVLAAGPVPAAIVSYSSTYSGADNYNSNVTAVRNLWENAITGLNTITFDSGGYGGYSGTGVLVIDPLNNFSSPYPNNCGVVTLTNAQACFARVNGGSNGRYVTDAESPVPTAGGNRVFRGITGNGTSQYTEVRLSSDARAFAVDLYTLSSGGQNVRIQIFDSTSTLIADFNSASIIPTNNSATPAFFGVTSTTALGSVRFSSTTGDTALDNFFFSNALNGGGGGGGEDPPGETPESATLGYIGMGLIALLASRKKVKLPR